MIIFAFSNFLVFPKCCGFSTVEFPQVVFALRFKGKTLSHIKLEVTLPCVNGRPRTPACVPFGAQHFNRMCEKGLYQSRLLQLAP